MNRRGKQWVDRQKQLFPAARSDGAEIKAPGRTALNRFVQLFDGETVSRGSKDGVSPAMVPRIPSALPSESSRRELTAPHQGWYESRQLHRCSRIQYQILQWTGGGWYTQFSWQQ